MMPNLPTVAFEPDSVVAASAEDLDDATETEAGLEDSNAVALQELVSQYKSALAELTFNSKPIITNLTIIAGENLHAAKSICAIICAHILEVSKEQKLPSLYLLDSIVKNIGGEFVRYFAARLPEVFCKSYRQVDATTFPAMQHLFRTWRGIFPAPTLSYIEEELQLSSVANGSTASTAPPRPIESPSSRTGHGMHINSKYIEAAHRQRLQPTSRVSQRGDDVYGEPGFARDASFGLSDYDFSKAARTGMGVSRKMEVDDNWEGVWSGDIDGDADTFSSEVGASRWLRLQNGYDWRQPSSKKSSFDGYGYNRGPGPGTGISSQFLDGDVDRRRKLVDGQWTQLEDEDYVYDTNARVQENEQLGVNNTQNYWYSVDAERVRGRGVGRSKMSVLNSGLDKTVSWPRQRHVDQHELSLIDDRLTLSRDLEGRGHSHLHGVLGSREKISTSLVRASDQQSLQLSSAGVSRNHSIHGTNRHISPTRLSAAEMALPASASSEGSYGMGLGALKFRLRPSVVDATSSLVPLSPVTPGARLLPRHQSTSTQLQQLPPPPLPQGRQSQVQSVQLQQAQAKQLAGRRQVVQSSHYQQSQILECLSESQQQPQSQALTILNQVHLSQQLPALEASSRMPQGLSVQVLQQLASSGRQLSQQVIHQSHGQPDVLMSASQDQDNSDLLSAFMQSGIVPQSQSARLAPPLSPTGASSHLVPDTGLPSVQRQQQSTMFSYPVGLVGSRHLPGSLNGVSGNTSQNLPYPHPPTGSPASASTVSEGGLPSQLNISSLLSSLLANGVLTAASSCSDTAPVLSSLSVPGSVPPLSRLEGNLPVVAASVPAAQPVVSQHLLELRKERYAEEPFKLDILRERCESVINAIYFDIPRQCKTCGLRFHAQEEHSRHMDWHVSRNRRQKSQKKTSRKWFVGAKEWLSGTGVSAADVAPPFFSEDAQSKVKDQDTMAVPSDENQSSCALCGEPFENFYSDETDEWMYKGAVYMNIPPGQSTEGLDSSQLGPIVHAKCRTESEATAAAATATVSSEDDDEVQVELLATAGGSRDMNGREGDVLAHSINNDFDISGLQDHSDDSGGKRKRVRY